MSLGMGIWLLLLLLMIHLCKGTSMMKYAFYAQYNKGYLWIE
jgi:Na+-transporting methylmalonyl-CoA/oxaloacetate decarboxylase gamma subunit